MLNVGFRCGDKTCCHTAQVRLLPCSFYPPAQQLYGGTETMWLQHDDDHERPFIRWGGANSVRVHAGFVCVSPCQEFGMGPGLGSTTTLRSMMLQCSQSRPFLGYMSFIIAGQLLKTSFEPYHLPCQHRLPTQGLRTLPEPKRMRRSVLCTVGRVPGCLHRRRHRGSVRHSDSTGTQVGAGRMAALHAHRGAADVDADCRKGFRSRTGTAPYLLRRLP